MRRPRGEKIVRAAKARRTVGTTSSYDGPGLVERARIFAIAAYEAVGQIRNGIGKPAGVAAIVESVPHTPEMVAAAWLHDVVEDTGVSLATIKREFGPIVGRLIEELTDVYKPGDSNQTVRKKINLAHTAKASPAGQTIKLADIIHSCQATNLSEPGFAKVWLAEKARQLAVLTKGDSSLRAVAEPRLLHLVRRLAIASEDDRRSKVTDRGIARARKGYDTGVNG